MANAPTHLNAQLMQMLAQYRAELDALNNAILVALGQPSAVNIQGSIAYTNRSLKELRDMRNEVLRVITAIETGETMTRVLPRYWRTQGAYPR